MAELKESSGPGPRSARPEAPKCDLPDDIPGRDFLIAAGLTTKQAVCEVGDLTSVEGIGPADVTAIRKAAGWKGAEFAR